MVTSEIIEEKEKSRVFPEFKKEISTGNVVVFLEHYHYVYIYARHNDRRLLFTSHKDKNVDSPEFKPFNGEIKVEII